MTDKQSLYSKLAAVSAEVAHVGKDGTNSFHKYKFTSAGAVMAKVNPALASRGIATTSKVEVEHRVRLADAQGNDKGEFVTVRVLTTFTDGITGESCVSEALGSGTDNGDKAVMKAQTAAHKYMLKMTFNIDFGDDPEADAKTDKLAERAAAPVARPGAVAPKPAAPAARPVQGSLAGAAESYMFKYGKNKNRPIGELTDAEVDWYLQGANAELNDPEKAKFHAYTQKAIDACTAVLQARHDARMAAGSDLPMANGAALFGDDEMPV